MGADVIIVGAGYGGLTTAAILAHNGVEVQILEATGHIGGRASYDRKDDFLVDYGIHLNAYASSGAAAKALREINYDIEFISLGKPQLFIEDKFVPMPTGAASFFKTGFMSMSNKIIVGHGIRKIFTARYERIADLPISQVISGADREEVREFFRLLSMMSLVTTDIEVASAGEMQLFFKRIMRARGNVGYPKGGTSQIIETLASKIRENGKIDLQSRVTSIEIEGGKVKSVRAKGKDIPAKAYVFAVPVQKFARLVGDSLPAEYLGRCSSLIPTSGISLDLCLKEKVSDIDGIIFSVEPITLGQFTSNIDPECAPQGKQLATFFLPVSNSIISEKKAVEHEKQVFIDLIERMFPGIFEKVICQRLLVLKMVDGFEPRIGQTMKDRPKTQVPEVENLFLAGDTVGVHGKGGDVAFTAGVEAAKAVIDYLR